MNDVEKAGLILALEMDPEFRARVRELLISEAPVRTPRPVQRAAVPARLDSPEYRPATNPQRAIRNRQGD